MRKKFKIIIFKLINKVRLFFRGSNYFGKRLTMHLDQRSFLKMTEPFLPAGYKLVPFDDSLIDELEIFYLKSDLGYCDLGYWKSYVLNEGYLVVIDLKTNSIIASCFAAYSPRSFDIGRLEWFVVDKRHRGVGIGKYIAYFVTLLLSKEKFRKIELDTFEYMNSARAIYSKLGWKDEK
jgi:GNAT superfamily N-acetyltransferase